MSEELKNKIIQKLKASGKDVSKSIKKLNDGDLYNAAIECDKTGLVFINIYYESQKELGLV